MRRLALDYFTYVGMVFFCFALWILARPLAWLERVTNRPVRENVIAWIGRISHA